ncbi:hypothetical protein [Streptomyces sp. NRRL F-5755]|uniref:hypothetical protein n=1 Tax=Streptomyces sp. NRRL F-5755 TaxID=1519475 RepID=UPI000A4D96DD|nr:hypothetical protein [Streptomyces sp. NRRL F-5755]
MRDGLGYPRRDGTRPVTRPVTAEVALGTIRLRHPTLRHLRMRTDLLPGATPDDR